MIITISGTPGSGKTTVADILAKKLRLKHYYMGGIRRDAAKAKGMTIDEFNKLGESDPSTDKIVDDYLVKLGKTEDNFIAEGRTAAHFIPHSVKIFMDVDLAVGAERIFKETSDKEGRAKRNEDVAKTIAQKVRGIKARVDSDTLRYKKYYGLNVLDKKMYDLWIDTTKLAPEQVVDKITLFLDKRKK